ncbi:MAG: hypothetical protein AB7G88_13035, partial [Thermomicrobiales bacterium]
GAWVPPEGTDDLTAPRAGEAYGPAAGTPSGGPWYGPHGSLGPEPPEYRPIKPPMPIKPRGERGNKWLRYLLAALLLTVVIGGSAFAITWFLDDDDDNGNQQPQVAQTEPTPTPESDAAAPAVTETPQTLGEPTATSEPAPEPTQTPEPDQSDPAPTAEGAASAGESSTEGQSAEEGTTIIAAADYLPTTDELTGAWLVFDEGDRSRAEVGEQLGEGGEDLLLSLRWRENQYRDFTLEGGENLPDETTFLSVSVHRFGTEEGAREAVTVLADILIGAGYQLASPVEIGNSSSALEGPNDGANVYVLYVQDGNIVIRFGGSSVTGDPTPFVNAVAEQVLAAA